MTSNTLKKKIEKTFFEGKRIPTRLYAFVLAAFIVSLSMAIVRHLFTPRERLIK